MPVTHAARRHVTGIARHAQLAGLLLLGCASLAVAADRVAALSDEFLEYLGSLESDDENWMDFTAEANGHGNASSTSSAASVAAPSAASVRAASSSSSASANTNATSRVTGKADK
jgi:hypothetical protein